MSRERGIWIAAGLLGALAAILAWIFVTEDNEPARDGSAAIASERSEGAGPPELRADRAESQAPTAGTKDSSEPAASAPAADRAERRDAEAARTLRGITADETGAPVPHATLVYGSADGRAFRVCGASDAAGRFALAREARQTSLGAFAAGHEPAAAFGLPLDLAAPIPDEIRLVLQRGGGRLRGVVRDEQGNAIAAAEVHAKLRAAGGTPPPTTEYSRSLTVIARSDAEGKFALEGVPSAELWVGARADGLATLWATAQVPLHGEAFVELLVRVPVSVRGTITDRGGQPVGSASVFTLPRTFPDDTFDIAQTQSDAEGRYELRGIQPGEFRLRVSSRAHETLELMRFGGAGETLEWNPVLGSGPTIRGKLFDLEDRAAAGWKIVSGDPRQRTNPAPVTTDDQGRFEVAGVKEWGYTLLFHPPGDEGSLPLFSVEDVRAAPEEQFFRVPEETGRLARVRGRVLDAASNSLAAPPKIRLTREPRGVVEAAWEAAEDSFVSPPLPPGSYLLRVKAVENAELVRRIELRGEDLDAGTLNATAGAELRVTLDDASRSEQVFCFLYDDAQRFRWMAKAEGAELAFPRVPAGDYVLRVEPRPFSKDGALHFQPFGAIDRPLRLDEGAVHRESISVVGAQRVSLEIEAPEDVRSARLEVRGEGDRLARSIDVVRYGREALQAALQLPPGTWQISAQLAGGRVARAEVRVTEVKAEELRVAVPLLR